jgi:uncharacterized protein YihD (DUF1040 family)
MIGAAKQERLLEERHRLRQQEKKSSDDPADRDPRFDDVDDDFDYDAMMDDDGLEERIPGVNADYDEEEDFGAAMDPDNDQENFAGFTFQRSNPASSLVSPHTPTTLATPRDATGQPIGFAMTHGTTPELPTAESPFYPNPLRLSKQDDMSGLGIQGFETTATGGVPQSVYRPSQPPPRADDFLFIDDGLADELDFEHDGAPFDESIFDINDTDQFGRPIPGAFAQAKEAMQTAHQQQQQPPNRDSDMTSSASAQSGVAKSTGHTSPSAGFQQPIDHQQSADDSSSKPDYPEAMTMMDMPDQDLAYQAALAEAAQNAAASGKFQRPSSPDVLAGLADPHLDDPAERYLNDYDDDAFTNDFDDFAFDDEAIIAEANASALANDADGFYGQEFGFYSAPIPQHQPSSHYNSHHQSSSSSPGGSGAQTSETVFQYANGGYFGPTGAAFGRSTSGRVVSREPNLTPITERSEYSNRNSIMSFTLPPAITSEGNGVAGSRNSASAMPSPGLAQLASLMSDEAAAADNHMTLSALMKLRSKAWGGSQASLVSSREGSPRSERADSPYGTVPAHLAGHVRVNSALSLWSCSEAAEEQEQEGAPPQSGSGAASPAMATLPHPPTHNIVGVGTAFPGILPPRPGSAGAILNSSGSGGTPNRAASPLPQRPQSLFLPPQAPLQIPSPGHSQGQLQAGRGPCSPVLEGEEEGAATAAAAGGGDDGEDRGDLAPALPLRTKSSEV